MPFVLSIAIAGCALLLLGSALLGRVYPRARVDLPFTSIYFGQMALWFASYLVLPINAGLAALTGHSFSLGVLVWIAALTAFVLQRRREAPDGALSLSPANAPVFYLFAVGAGAAIVKVALAYSSDSHLGALGLDTHQHIYWTKQLLDAGHVPLVERDTSILALYPRGFHLLVALYSGAGFSAAIGAWVKLMPFLQAFLPCLVLAELVAVQLLRPNAKATNRSSLIIVALMLAALIVYGFAGSRMIYPEYDLNGTPRFASSAALMLPYLLFLAGNVLRNQSMQRLAWLALPATALLLLALNAVLVVQLIVFVLPLMAVTMLLAAPTPATGAKLALAWVAPLAIGVPLAIAAGDPWIVALWTGPLGAAGQAFLDTFSVMTPDQAATLGLLSKDELVTQTSEAVLYAGIGPTLGLFAASIAGGVTDWFATGWAFPFYDDLSTHRARIMLRCVVVASIVLAVYNTSKQAGEVSDRSRRALRLFCGLALGLSLGGAAQLSLIHFSQGLAIGRGYEFTLLRDYCEVAPRHIALVGQAFLLLGALGTAAATLRPRLQARTATFSTALLATLLGAVATLPFALYGQSDVVEPGKSFWAPLAAEDLVDLREIEAHIDGDDGVMVPSNTWGIGKESWIVPQGPTASVLPFATKRILFNSRLGQGVFFNWKDLASFCRGTNQERADFLGRNDVRWYLVKGKRTTERTFYQKFRMCKLRLAEMGVVYPPVHRAGDLSLYAIDPQSLLPTEQ